MKYITKKDLVFPKRKARKGQNGRVLVVGGSSDYVGAPVLGGLSALRSGCDWVTLALPEKVGWAASSLSLDLVIKKFKGSKFGVSHVKEILKLEEGFDVVLIGNGIGMDSTSFVRKYVKNSKKKLVIDADAVKSVRLQDVNNAIFTPHEKEFEILLKNSGLNKNNYRKELGSNVILLKGEIDKIITKNNILYNKTGNSGMTRAGTGDVLAGLCAGLLAQGMNATQAASAAAYFNGKIGDILLKKHKGYSYLASDIARDIEKVLKRLK